MRTHYFWRKLSGANLANFHWGFFWRVFFGNWVQNTNYFSIKLVQKNVVGERKFEGKKKSKSKPDLKKVGKYKLEWPKTAENLIFFLGGGIFAKPGGAFWIILRIWIGWSAGNVRCTLFFSRIQKVRWYINYSYIRALWIQMRNEIITQNMNPKNFLGGYHLFECSLLLHLSIVIFHSRRSGSLIWW